MAVQTRHAAKGRARTKRDGSTPGTLIKMATTAAATTMASVADARATNQPFIICAATSDRTPRMTTLKSTMAVDVSAHRASRTDGCSRGVTGVALRASLAIVKGRSGRSLFTEVDSK